MDCRVAKRHEENIYSIWFQNESRRNTASKPETHPNTPTGCNYWKQWHSLQLRSCFQPSLSVSRIMEKLLARVSWNFMNHAVDTQNIFHFRRLSRTLLRVPLPQPDRAAVVEWWRNSRLLSEAQADRYIHDRTQERDDDVTSWSLHAVIGWLSPRNAPQHSMTHDTRHSIRTQCSADATTHLWWLTSKHKYKKCWRVSTSF